MTRLLDEMRAWTLLAEIRDAKERYQAREIDDDDLSEVVERVAERLHALPLGDDHDG